MAFFSVFQLAPSLRYLHQPFTKHHPYFKLLVKFFFMLLNLKMNYIYFVGLGVLPACMLVRVSHCVQCLRRPEGGAKSPGT